MAKCIPDLVKLWTPVSLFSPNEGEKVDIKSIWPKFLAKLPRSRDGVRFQKVMICDRYCSTRNQQASLFYLFKEIAQIRDARLKMEVVFWTEEIGIPSREHTTLWEEKWKNSDEEVGKKDVVEKMFREAFNNPHDEIDVCKLTKKRGSRSFLQHDRFLLLLVEENGSEVLHKVSLHRGLDLFTCLGCPREKEFDLQNIPGDVVMKRCDLGMSTFNFLGKDAMDCYEYILELTDNDPTLINKFHHKMLNKLEK